MCPTLAKAQSPCPHLAGNTFPNITDGMVICTVPQLYGPQGLAVEDFVGPLQNSVGAGGQFVPAKNNFLLSVNGSVASQIAVLPLVAPAAGISLVLDKSLGTYVVSNDSFGPIFSERATTVGRNRLALGFSYQYMNFDSLDGVDLHRFPTLFLQTIIPGTTTTCDPLQATGGCGATRDFMAAVNRIDLKINQFTAFATFGLTRRLDVSAAVPVLTVDMTAAAESSIVPNSGEPGFLSFGFATFTNFPKSNGSCLSTHTAGSTTYCDLALFSNYQRSSGIGDLTLRVKGTLREWEHSGLAAGVDIRVPTGDENNFLGTGAIGIKPFLVWSYGGRFSPHVNFGYEWNGQSVLAGDINTGTKDNLPSEFLYSAGVEAGITKRFTATFDLIGQTLMNGPRVHLVQTLAPGACDTPPFAGGCQNPGSPIQVTTIEGTKGTYAINNASLGLRLRPFGKFLISASVQIKLDDGGLRAKAIPMVSATYTLR